MVGGTVAVVTLVVTVGITAAVAVAVGITAAAAVGITAVEAEAVMAVAVDVEMFYMMLGVYACVRASVLPFVEPKDTVANDGVAPSLAKAANTVACAVVAGCAAVIAKDGAGAA